MAKTRLKKILKISLATILVIFVLLNIVAAMQAYKLTHFDDSALPINKDADVTLVKKAEYAIFGIDVPRPKTEITPSRPFEDMYVPVDSAKSLNVWIIRTDSIKKGTVALFHGYMDEKSSMLDRAYAILDMGYDVILTDFMGAGNSFGNQTTIGYKEAENVKSVYEYILKDMGEDSIYLLGFSMGAVAIAKAQSDYNMLVHGIILEAPYATFLGTVEKRFEQLGVPSFPMAQLMTFWGGVENGIDAFGMNPIADVRNIEVPVLLMAGTRDPHIPVDETKAIYNNIASSSKEVVFFADSKHESYLPKHKVEWEGNVKKFLTTFNPENLY